MVIPVLAVAALLTLVLIAPGTAERGLREIQNCVGVTAAGDGFDRQQVVAQRDTDSLCRIDMVHQ